MSTEELREKIEQHQNAIQTKQNELCAIRQHIIDEVKPFIKGEMKKRVDSEVKKDPDHTKDLG